MNDVCTYCGGTFEQQAQTIENPTWHKVSCLALDSQEEIWAQIKWLLGYFIRCSVDGKYDGEEDPFNGKCEGCVCDREHILNYIWHYGEEKYYKGLETNKNG